MMTRQLSRIAGIIFGLAYLGLAVPAVAETEPAADAEAVLVPLSQPGALVDFMRDVQPILAEKCLKCHGPDESKGGFRVDEADTLLSYVEPEDLESSSLWADYLVTDDPEMRMPPPGDDPSTALSGSQLATLKLWIEEGASCPDVLVAELPVAAEEPQLPRSQAARLWSFQGLFHPASVHFPIALLTISAGFVLLSFVRPQTCQPVAFHCLWIGALGALVACVSGWSYAVYEGYGSGFSLDLQNSAIDRHRWLGVTVAALSILLIPLALRVQHTQRSGLRLLWLLGSLALLGAVGITGYQGGELTYGEDHYQLEFERLFPEWSAGESAIVDEGEAPPADPASTPAEETEDEATEDEATPAADTAVEAAAESPETSPAQTEDVPQEPASEEPAAGSAAAETETVAEADESDSE
ncbi:MAG: hypothetical protein KDA45_08595 [Planctomycetales bacterium]|nr:hypothetical protein [Planctomycetales bacterium]